MDGGGHLVGNRVRLALGGLVRIADLVELGLQRGAAAAALLYRVDELVGDEAIAGAGAGLVFTGSEIQVLPDGIGPRAHGRGRVGRRRTGVHADVAEVRAGRRRRLPGHRRRDRRSSVFAAGRVEGLRGPGVRRRTRDGSPLDLAVTVGRWPVAGGRGEEPVVLEIARRQRGR